MRGSVRATKLLVPIRRFKGDQNTRIKDYVRRMGACVRRKRKASARLSSAAKVAKVSECAREPLSRRAQARIAQDKAKAQERGHPHVSRRSATLFTRGSKTIRLRALVCSPLQRRPPARQQELARLYRACALPRSRAHNHISHRRALAGARSSGSKKNGGRPRCRRAREAWRQHNWR